MASPRSTRTTVLTGLALAPLALGLVACGGDDDATDPASSSSPASSPSTPTDSAPADSADSTAPSSPSESASAPAAGTSDDATLLAAAQVALDAVAGSTVFSVDLDSSGWEVHVVTPDGVEHEVEVNPAGTEVTRPPRADQDDDDNDDVAERKQLLSEAKLDHAAAIDAVRATDPDGQLTGLDLDTDFGAPVWDVDLDEDTADERTVSIDAVTGEVRGTERDD